MQILAGDSVNQAVGLHGHVVVFICRGGIFPIALLYLHCFYELHGICSLCINTEFTQ